MWENIRTPGRNPHSETDNMQTPHRKAQADHHARIQNLLAMLINANHCIYVILLQDFPLQQIHPNTSNPRTCQSADI